MAVVKRQHTVQVGACSLLGRDGAGSSGCRILPLVLPHPDQQSTGTSNPCTSCSIESQNTRLEADLQGLSALCCHRCVVPSKWRTTGKAESTSSGTQCRAGMKELGPGIQA